VASQDIKKQSKQTRSYLPTVKYRECDKSGHKKEGEKARGTHILLSKKKKTSWDIKRMQESKGHLHTIKHREDDKVKTLKESEQARALTHYWVLRKGQVIIQNKCEQAKSTDCLSSIKGWTS
jgi:hypothetical protein